MNLSNIAIGTNNLIYHIDGKLTASKDTDDSAISVSAYVDSNKTVINTYDHETDDGNTFLISNTLRGIILDGKCLTLVPELTASSAFSFTQTGTYKGRIFNQFVGNNSGKVWGFEAYISPKTTGVEIPIAQYGYSEPGNTNNRKSNWKLLINSSNRLAFRYAAYFTQYGKWNSKEIALTNISQLTVEQWYHICFVRLSDGSASHGNYDSMITLVYCQPISDITTYSRRYLNRISYSNGVWGLPTDTDEGTTTVFASSALSTAFVQSSGVTSGGWMGRLDPSQEYTVPIDLFTVGSNNLQMSGIIHMRGGAYEESSMEYNIATQNISTSTNASSYTVNITTQSVPTANYLWVPSIIV